MYSLKPWFASHWYFCESEARVTPSLSQPLRSHTKRGEIAPCQPCLYPSWKKKKVIFACKKTQKILPTTQRNHIHACMGCKCTWENPLEFRNGAVAQRHRREPFPLVSGHTKPLRKFFHSRHPSHQKNNNNKNSTNCAHQGLHLATSTCKCKASHSTFGAWAFQMQMGSHWTGFTSCGVQCTQPPTQKWEWHRKL